MGHAGQAEVAAAGRQQFRRLRRRFPTVNGAGQSVQRTVDESGYIVDTIMNENGEVVVEDVIGNLADLPVEGEDIDDQGRIVSRVSDESGNVYEQVLDEEGNLVGARAI